MNRDKLTDDLIWAESLELKPYRDSVGKLTIGIGRNLDDVGISEAEARMLCRNDLERVEKDLDLWLPWWRALDEVRQRVLADMCFNMGIGNAKRGLLSFATTLRLIESGHYDTAALNMMKSQWAAQTGRRARRLSAMMRTGVDQPYKGWD